MILIGHEKDGTTHWLADACSDCNTTILKERAWSFASVDAAKRGIVLFLSPKLAWFIEVDGEIVHSADYIAKAICEANVKDYLSEQAEGDGWLSKFFGTFQVTSTGDGHCTKAKKSAYVTIFSEVDVNSIERDADGKITYAYCFFQARFSLSQWDTETIGYMYTDSGIEAGVNAVIAAEGFTGTVGWSESGRQALNEADFDMSYELIDQFWPQLRSAV